MEIIDTSIADIKIIKPKVFKDKRGYFTESFKADFFQSNFPGIQFIQDNESKSSKGVLRGLHYQLAPYAQTKLVRVVVGKVIDIAVDLRKESPTYLKHIAIELSDENKHQLLIPKGFAHGFIVLSDEAVFHYKVDAPYTPQQERSIRFDDKTLNIPWSSFGIESTNFILSEKDLQAPNLSHAEINF